MKSVAFFKMAAAAALLLLLVGAVGYVSVGHLKRNARLIVQDTLPGLAHGSAVSAELAQGFNDLMVFVLTEDSREREKRRQAIDSTRQSITEHLNIYERSIFDETQTPERRYFAALVEKRQKCHEIRLKIMAAVDQQKRPDAISLFEREFQPAYEAYREAAQALTEFNIRQGEERGREILTVCTLTQVFVGFVGVFLFLAGFFMGLFR
jgi:hypothetical protein